MPFFVTAHALCSSWDGPRNSDFLRTVRPTYKGIFARFMTMQEKQIVTRAVGIQKENRVTMHFSEIIESLNWKENAIHCSVF